MNMKRCQGPCGEEYPEIFFGKNVVRNSNPRRSWCLACEQTKRDEHKQSNRDLVKARSCIRSHRRRWNAKYPDDQLTDQEFAQRFDWDAHQMAHDIGHAKANGCQRCRRSFASMPNGLRDVTLDIIDPRQLPYYRTNCRWICDTCNKAKGGASPDEDGIRLHCWGRWEKRMAELKEDPWMGTLFEGLGSVSDSA
jgi:hypothetical protein